jgi:VIT1/CCC1 family predicted Fe2+/Mn2+ transporter
VSRDDLKQAVFGGMDGLSSAIGMIAALALSGSGAVLVAAVALAVGSAVSMAAGEWLSDPEQSSHRALVMGVATLAGALLPAVPFAVLSGGPADAACLLVTMGLAGLVAELRPEDRLQSYARTLGVLILTCSAAVGASVLAGPLG